MGKDIVLVCDYHDQNLVFCWFNEVTGEVRTLKRRTEPAAISEVLTEAMQAAGVQGGQVVWIMESTTGWARVQPLVERDSAFLTVNVLQVALPPKAKRRKTDKLDTARLLREYEHGQLPRAYQPSRSVRRLRRVVDCHQSLIRRRTALRNYLNRYLAHETWVDRPDLSAIKGRRSLAELARGQRGWDRHVLQQKLGELEAVMLRIAELEATLERVARRWATARRIDAIRGIGPIGAVAIAARIGDVRRFGSAEQLIGYAGLAPAVRQSDQTCRHGRLAGAGTDALLRHYVIEASVWARQLPRYEKTYGRVAKRRGSKVGRLVVARSLLRSVYVMLRDGVAFEPTRQAA